MLLACLPWYDLVETRDSTDALWSRVAAAGLKRGVEGIPKTLYREADYKEHWRSPDLLLGQACGYDVCLANHHALQIVGVPRFEFQGCEGKCYRSFVVVRDDSPFRALQDLRGTCCVINSPRSHSGMNALQALITPHSKQGHFFGQVQISGAHERSLQRITSGQADVAAIDCITYALLKRHRPLAVRGTRIIGESPPVTAPPYVTGSATDGETIELLRESIADAIEALPEAHRERLGLLGIEAGSIEDYDGIAQIERDADAQGYRELREMDGNG